MIGKLWLWLGAVGVVAVGVVAFLSLGRGTSGTLAQQVRSWASSTSLGQDIGTVVGDGASVRRALAAHKGMAAVHTVCAAMANDAQTDNDSLPSPDTTLTQLLSRAYSLAYDAAEACARAPTPSSTLLATSAHDRTRAAVLFTRALERVHQLTGTSVPTTTTTVPDLTGTSLF